MTYAMAYCVNTISSITTLLQRTIYRMSQYQQILVQYPQTKYILKIEEGVYIRYIPYIRNKKFLVSL